MDKGTRRKILDILKREGPGTASEMAALLGVSAMAVRQHLYALTEEGLVEAVEKADGVGRPSKFWQLTAAADAFFPQGYAELTAGLMGGLQRAFGDKGLEQIIAARTDEQIISYGERMEDAHSVKDRLRALAELRTEEGYMAEVREDEQGFVFIENHCPICIAARTCTGLCASELSLFRAVLGNDVQVERTEHILQGARRCAYKVTAV